MSKQKKVRPVGGKVINTTYSNRSNHSCMYCTMYTWLQTLALVWQSTVHQQFARKFSGLSQPQTVPHIYH